MEDNFRELFDSLDTPNDTTTGPAANYPEIGLDPFTGTPKQGPGAIEPAQPAQPESPASDIAVKPVAEPQPYGEAPAAPSAPRAPAPRAPAIRDAGEALSLDETLDPERIIEDAVKRESVRSAWKALKKQNEEGGAVGILGDNLGVLKGDERKARIAEIKAQAEEEKAAAEEIRVRQIDGTERALAELSKYVKDPQALERMKEIWSKYDKETVPKLIGDKRKESDRLGRIAEKAESNEEYALKGVLRSGVENFATGASGIASSVVKSVGYGAQLAQKFTGIDPGAEIDDNLAVDIARWIEEKSKQLFPGDASRQEDFSQKFAQGAGSMIGFYGPGIITKMMGMSNKASTALVAALGALAESGETTDDALRSLAAGRDVSDKDILFSYILGIGLGATEAVPFAHFASPGPGGVARSIAAQIIEEGSQEAFQTFGENATARYLHDPSRNLGDGVAEAAIIGGILGGIMQGGQFALSGRAREFARRPESPQPETDVAVRTPDDKEKEQPDVSGLEVTPVDPKDAPPDPLATSRPEPIEVDITRREAADPRTADSDSGGLLTPEEEQALDQAVVPKEPDPIAADAPEADPDAETWDVEAGKVQSLPKELQDYIARTNPELADKYKIPPAAPVEEQAAPEQETDGIYVDPDDGFPMAETEIQDIYDTLSTIREQERATRPKPLTQFLVDRGRLRDEGGELKQIFDKLTYLRSNRGMSLDDAAFAAWEAGYLTGYERPDINAFLDLLREEAAGNKVYSESDRSAMMDFRELEQLEVAYERYGLNRNSTLEDVRNAFRPSGARASGNRSASQEAGAAGTSLEDTFGPIDDGLAAQAGMARGRNRVWRDDPNQGGLDFSAPPPTEAARPAAQPSQAAPPQISTQAKPKIDPQIRGFFFDLISSNISVGRWQRILSISDVQFRELAKEATRYGFLRFSKGKFLRTKKSPQAAAWAKANPPAAPSSPSSPKAESSQKPSRLGSRLQDIKPDTRPDAVSLVAGNVDQELLPPQPSFDQAGQGDMLGGVSIKDKLQAMADKPLQGAAAPGENLGPLFGDSAAQTDLVEASRAPEAAEPTAPTFEDMVQLVDELIDPEQILAQEIGAIATIEDYETLAAAWNSLTDDQKIQIAIDLEEIVRTAEVVEATPQEGPFDTPLVIPQDLRVDHAVKAREAATGRGVAPFIQNYAARLEAVRGTPEALPIIEEVANDSDVTKDHLQDLAAVVGVKVAKSWSKGKIRDAMRAALSTSNPMPQAIKDTSKPLNSGREDASDISVNLEQNQPDGASGDGLGATGVPDGRGGDGPVPGDGIRQDATDGGSIGDSLVLGDGPALVGGEGDSSVQAGAPGASGGVAGLDVGGRGSGDGLGGQAADEEAAGPAGQAFEAEADASGQFSFIEADTKPDRAKEKAASSETFKKLTEAQKEAESTPVVLNDEGNVRATLPILKPAQQDDVIKAEARLSKPDGHGFMLTNGTGTGKTFSGLGVVKRFAKQGKTNILILAPSQDILTGWIEAAKHFQLDVTRLRDTKDAGDGIVATTYANLRENVALGQRDWDLVVTDEAQKISEGKTQDAQVLEAFRALTNHTPYLRARLEMAPVKESIEALQEAVKTREATMDDVVAAQLKYDSDLAKRRQDLESKPKSKVLFLSATPFAYRKSTDYAEGFLFDYPPRKTGYNDPGGRDEFLVQNFGYSMRYNRAEEPGPEVNTDVLERAFHEKLRRDGVLSGRRLEVEADYDRKFILVDDAVGARIDQALKWLDNQGNGRYRKLAEIIKERFDSLARRRLLEAIKAKHVIPRIRKDLEMGRKVVVFHDYIEGEGFDPFALDVDRDTIVTLPQKDEEGNNIKVKIGELYDEFVSANPYVRTLNFAELKNPITQITKAFPEAMQYNGRVSKKTRQKAREAFQTDGSGKDIIIVQSDAGEAGISLHDTTGKHQRILYNLGLPTRPTRSIQQEGRIYREGQVSNAILRYMSTGTNWERIAFAQSIAERAATAENLALGEEARTIRESFIDAFQDADVYEQEKGEGIGGKAQDRSRSSTVSPFEKAKTYYYSQGKKRGRRDQREGLDYFATPEPIGLKMVEWADIKPGERVLEPSAGHGAIARWLPESSDRTLIEPSMDLSSRAALSAPGARIRMGRFEDLDIRVKYDAIVMNPPFGSGGKTAYDHVQKALSHIRNGGRVVAIVPRGPAADKRLTQMMAAEENKDIHLVAVMDMPGVMFERAGTSVATRVLVFEKQVGENISIARNSSDLSGVKSVSDLFDAMENLTVPARSPVQVKEAAGEVVTSVGGMMAVDEAVEQPAASTATSTIRFDLREVPSPINSETRFVARNKKIVAYPTYKRLLKFAEAAGGRYVQGRDGGFFFKSPDDRTRFLAAVAAAFPENSSSPPAPETNAAAAAPQEVSQADQGVEFVLSSPGAGTFIAKFAKYYDKAFAPVQKIAKKHGGGYASRAGTRGFYFSTEKQRAAFLAEVSAAGKEILGQIAPASAINTVSSTFIRAIPSLSLDLSERIRRIVPDAVSIQFHQRIVQNGMSFWGLYRPARRLMEISVEGNPDLFGTVVEESVHASRMLGLFTDGEWAVLRERAEKTVRDAADKQDYIEFYNEQGTRNGFRGERLKNYVDEAVSQEFVADLATSWANDGARYGSKIDNLLNRIKQFFEAVGNALRGHGFLTVQDIRDRFMSGQIAGRAVRGAPEAMRVTQREIDALQMQSPEGNAFAAEIMGSIAQQRNVIADAAAKNDAIRTIKRGMEYEVAPETIEAIQEFAVPFEAIMPRGAGISVIKRVKPHSNPALVSIELEHIAGSNLARVPTDLVLPIRVFKTFRGGYIREFGVVVVGRVGAVENIGQSTRGVIGHEIVHALWRALPGDVRSRLLSHANALRVLKTPISQWAREIGDGDARLSETDTLEAAYRKKYVRRENLQDHMDQEAVAHMMERYIHGNWSAAEIAPVEADLRAILSGQYANASVVGEQGEIEMSMAYAFAGENAATADKGRLSLARQLQAEGVSDQEIWERTGWYSRPDGWRFEIDDSKFKLRMRAISEKKSRSLLSRLSSKGSASETARQMILNHGSLERARRRVREIISGPPYSGEDTDWSAVMKALDNYAFSPGLVKTKDRFGDRDVYYYSGSLGDLIEAPDLFAAYPQLRDIHVAIGDATSLTSGGSFNLDRRMISVTTSDNLDAIMSTLLHEVQHGIQIEEGFDVGGSGGTLAYRTEAALFEVNQQIADLRVGSNIRAELERLRDELREQAGRFSGSIAAGLAVKDTEIDAYERLLGEVEARNVQSRMSMSADERRASVPSSTEDIPRDQQYSGTSLIRLRGEHDALIDRVVAEEYASMPSMEREDRAGIAGEMLYETVYLHDSLRGKRGNVHISFEATPENIADVVKTYGVEPVREAIFAGFKKWNGKVVVDRAGKAVHDMLGRIVARHPELAEKQKYVVDTLDPEGLIERYEGKTYTQEDVEHLSDEIAKRMSDLLGVTVKRYNTISPGVVEEQEHVMTEDDVYGLQYDFNAQGLGHKWGIDQQYPGEFEELYKRNKGLIDEYRFAVESARYDANKRAVGLSYSYDLLGKKEVGRTDVDALGYYSAALEAARSWPQSKGTPEQALMWLKKSGVKDAEIEATKLNDLLDGKRSVTRDDVIAHLEANRVGLREASSGGGFQQSLLDEYALDTYGYPYNELSPNDQRSVLVDVYHPEDGEGRLDTIYSRYSLDPFNPSYRETRLHLPPNVNYAGMLPFDKYLERERARGNVSSEDAIRAKYDDAARTQDDFRSGHFPEPNIVGHMMTSMVRLPAKVKFTPAELADIGERMAKAVGAKRVEDLGSGAVAAAVRRGAVTEAEARGFASARGWATARDSAVPDRGAPVFLIDQIQSDWGQKLRDGGVRDEAKIAELRRSLSDAEGRLINAWDGRELPDGHRGPPEEAVWLVPQNERPPGMVEAANDIRRLKAELRTAETSAPGNPLVNTTDQWVNTTLRRAIRQAAEADADYIAIPSGDTVLSYNPGDTDGMRGFYDGIVPKNLRNLLRKIDKKSPDPIRVDQVETPTKGMAGRGFSIFPLTDKVKETVVDTGQPMFAIGAETLDADQIAKEEAEWDLFSNETYINPKENVDALAAQWEPLLNRVPSDARVGVIEEIKPIGQKNGLLWVQVTFKDVRDGSYFKDVVAWEQMKESRAFVAKIRDANRKVVDYAIVNGRLAHDGTTTESAKAELRHETLHYLRAKGFDIVHGEVWGRLVAAAHEFGVLDIPTNQYIRRIGQNASDITTMSLRDDYMDMYAQHGLDVETTFEHLDEEAVAHMLELREIEGLPANIRQPIEDFLVKWDTQSWSQGVPRSRSGREMPMVTLPDGNKVPGVMIDAAIAAWHGSPHDFPPVNLIELRDGTRLYQNLLEQPDLPEGARIVRRFPAGRFDMSKVGTGEGAQAYGRGLYFAESKGVAEWYKDKLTDGGGYVLTSADGTTQVLRPGTNEVNAAYAVDMSGGDFDRAIRQYTGDGPLTPIIRKWQADGARVDSRVDTGNVYEVRVNAAPDDFLDWDKPLSQQSEKVRAAFAGLGITDDLPGHQLMRAVQGLKTEAPPTSTGDALRDSLRAQMYQLDSRTGTKRGASEKILREAGIIGIRYLDQGSRAAGKGSRNYVVFDDEIIEIVAKNGEVLDAIDSREDADPNKREFVLPGYRTEVEFGRNGHDLGMRTYRIYDEKSGGKVASLIANEGLDGRWHVAGIHAEPSYRSGTHLESLYKAAEKDLGVEFSEDGWISPRKYRALQAANPMAVEHHQMAGDSFSGFWAPPRQIDRAISAYNEAARASSNTDVARDAKALASDLAIVQGLIPAEARARDQALANVAGDVGSEVLASMKGQPLPHQFQIGNASGTTTGKLEASLSDLADDISATLGIPHRHQAWHGFKDRYRLGKIGARYGLYNRNTGITRIKVKNDIVALAHEGGHKLEDRPSIAAELAVIKRRYARELVALVPNVAQNKISEGFAEWFQTYIMAPQNAARVAPRFHQAFENLLNNNEPGLLYDISRLQADWQSLLDASSLDVLRGRIAATEDKSRLTRMRDSFREGRVRQDMMSYLRSFYHNVVAKDNVWKRAENYLTEVFAENAGIGPLNRRQKIMLRNPLMSPYMAARMLNYASNHAAGMLRYGVRLNGSPLPRGASMQQALLHAMGTRDKMAWEGQQMLDFNAYLIARRMVSEFDRFAAGHRDIAPDLLQDEEQFRAVIQELEAAYPTFREAANMVHEYLGNVLKLKNQEGFIGDDLYAELSQREGYVPLQRDMTEDFARAVRSTVGSGNNAIPMIRRQLNSMRDFVSPVDAILRDAYSTMERVYVNRAVKTLANLAAAAGPGGSLLAEKVDLSKIEGTPVQLRAAVENALKQQNVPTAAAQNILTLYDNTFAQDTIATVYRRTNRISAKDQASKGHLFYWEGGEMKAILVGDHQAGSEIFDAIDNFGHDQSDFITAATLVSTQIFRAGILKDLTYIAANFIRDQVAVGILSRDFIPFATGLKGLYLINRTGSMGAAAGLATTVSAAALGAASIPSALVLAPFAILTGAWIGSRINGNLTASEALQRYTAMGGPSGGIASHVIDQSRKGDSSALRLDGFSAAPKWWQRVLRMMEVTETASRVAHMDNAYKRLRKDGLSEDAALLEAFLISTDVLDFQRRGASQGLHSIVRYIPFFNVAIQGTDAAIRTVAGKRETFRPVANVDSRYVSTPQEQVFAIGEEIRSGTTGLNTQWSAIIKFGVFSLLGALLSLYYRDDEEYEEFNSYMKATHIFFREPHTGTWIRLPKPFELGLGIDMMEAGIDALIKNDPRWYQRFFSGVQHNLIPPVDLPGFETMGQIGSMVGAAWSVAAGDNPYGKPEERPQDMKGLVAEDRYNAYTSEMGKMLGKMMGVSPYKVDRVVTGAGATMGRNILQTSNWILPRVNEMVGGTIPGVAKRPRAEMALEELPFVSRFTRRSARGAQSTQEFWKNMAYGTGAFIDAAGSYKDRLSKGQIESAQSLLNSIGDEKKAYALLQTHFDSARQGIHPMNRALSLGRVINGVRKDMLADELFSVDKKRPSKSRSIDAFARQAEGKIELSPSEAGKVNLILEDIQMRELRNALIATGVPGWKQRRPMDTDGLFKELAAVSPVIAKEVSRRIDKSPQKIYAPEAIAAQWPKVRDALLSEGAGARISTSGLRKMKPPALEVTITRGEAAQ